MLQTLIDAGGGCMEVYNRLEYVSKSQKQKRPFSFSKMCVRLFLKYGQGNGIDGGGGFPKISSLFIHENLSTKKKKIQTGFMCEIWADQGD
jgi:hypothetical protein